MTTIIWDPRTRELGADRRMVFGNQYSDTCRKIYAGKDFYFACAGDAGPPLRLLADAMERLKLPHQISENMFLDEMTAKDLLSFGDLFLDMVKGNDGAGASCQILMFVQNEDGNKILELCNNGLMVETPPNRIIAIGSGAEFAIGAVAAGATVAQAIAIAAKFNSGTCAECDIVKPFSRG